MKQWSRRGAWFARIWKLCCQAFYGSFSRRPAPNGLLHGPSRLAMEGAPDYQRTETDQTRSFAAGIRPRPRCRTRRRFCRCSLVCCPPVRSTCAGRSVGGNSSPQALTNPQKGAYIRLIAKLLNRRDAFTAFAPIEGPYQMKSRYRHTTCRNFREHSHDVDRPGETFLHKPRFLLGYETLFNVRRWKDF